MKVEKELAGGLDDYMCQFRVNYFGYLCGKMSERGRKRIWLRAAFPWYRGHAYPHLKNAGEGIGAEESEPKYKANHSPSLSQKNIHSLACQSPNAVIPAQLTFQNTKKVPLNTIRIRITTGSGARCRGASSQAGSERWAEPEREKRK